MPRSSEDPPRELLAPAAAELMLGPPADQRCHDLGTFVMMRLMMSPVDRNAVAADWRVRGFSCGLWVDPPGQVWADFVHDTDEVVMVVEGKVEFEVAGAIHRPQAGEELLIPAGARHTVRNVGPSESRWLYGYGHGKASGT